MRASGIIDIEINIADRGRICKGEFKSLPEKEKDANASEGYLVKSAVIAREGAPLLRPLADASRIKFS